MAILGVLLLELCLHLLSQERVYQLAIPSLFLLLFKELLMLLFLLSFEGLLPHGFELGLTLLLCRFALFLVGRDRMRWGSSEIVLFIFIIQAKEVD